MDFTRITDSLTALGYTVSCFSTAAEAASYLSRQITATTVGFAGSMTLEELGLYDLLRARNTVHWHQRIPQGMTSQQVRLAANAAPIYISSANAVAETGEIVNIDGNGNRVASLFYGHEKVYIVVGKNKIAPDYDAALWRARNIAAPQNARRVGAKTPCAARADRCYNCKSPQRICRGLSVLWGKPMTGAFEVVLIDQNLGF